MQDGPGTEGLWDIVTKTESCPDQTREADKYKKFVARRDRALATIVLSIDTSLLYLLGDPQDPAVVWEELSSQFQKRTWANKLKLRKKLFTLRLKEENSMKEHIKQMTEIFGELAVVAEPVSEEDKVVHLLASLPPAYDVLVTALESGSNSVPALNAVTERLLREEEKLKGKQVSESEPKALVTGGYPVSKPKAWNKTFNCHYCGKPGHLKRKSGSEWLVDSGATSHMVSDRRLLTDVRDLDPGETVTLGDGNQLEVKSVGNVDVEMLLPNGSSRQCSLQQVLYVPKLSYNLISVARATEMGKTVSFSNIGCEFTDDQDNVTAFATKQGSLYHLKINRKYQESVNAAISESKERLWHRRFGHLNEQSLQKLVKKELVNQLDYNTSRKIGTCEPCIGGKQAKLPFQTSSTSTSAPLELVH